MAVETEIKLPLSNMQDFMRRVQTLNPETLSARHFEDNFVLDFPNGRLRGQACLLRVRKTRDLSSVTFKGPPQPSTLFKKREELETQVAEADALLRIFEQLGMIIWFRYQKYREEFSVRTKREPGLEIHLAVDLTPIGDFAELEGPEQAIREIASTLGFTESQYVRESYYALYLRSCQSRREKPGHMVFADRDIDGGAPA